MVPVSRDINSLLNELNLFVNGASALLSVNVAGQSVTTLNSAFVGLAKKALKAKSGKFSKAKKKANKNLGIYLGGIN